MKCSNLKTYTTGRTVKKFLLGESFQMALRYTKREPVKIKSKTIIIAISTYKAFPDPTDIIHHCLLCWLVGCGILFLLWLSAWFLLPTS